ncbi:ABC transporter permease [Trueperella bialowiezensis]|uniref:Daunorubicin resistance ABC transporter membrane protein n=1 Tax=Trueperella bialowiezensis TaxID=312285 RepID=A0A448PET3_9ACTO|nr:ABC transporter permease [Trueperella bialowiezensis]VEI13455.1 daunorubicin resistance ABC transporter membrane protein [Trueperella bialowiezensis]
MKRMVILTKYHVASLWNWRSVYLGRLVEPVAYFVFLVAGISAMVSDSFGTDYVRYALTGIFCLLAFRVFTFTVSDVSNDRKWGVYAIFTMQGGSPRAYLLTILAVDTLVFLVQSAILLLAYVGVSGWSITAPTLTAIIHNILVAVLVVWGWAGLGAAIGALVDSYSTRDMISTLTSLPIVLSAPLFYTLDSVPTYLYAIAKVNPLTYHVEWIREPSIENMCFAALWAVICYAVGAFALQRSDRVSSER